MHDKSSRSPDGELGRAIDAYTQAAEDTAQENAEATARYEQFLVAQQTVREAYNEQIFAPRQAVWEEFTTVLCTEPALNWQNVDELWDKDGNGRALGDIRVMWEFERLEQDERGNAHAFITNVTAAIPLTMQEIAELNRAQAYLRRQQLGIQKKDCPSELLGLTPEKAKLRSFYSVKKLANRIDNFVRDKADEAVVIEANMDHSILGVDKPPQIFQARVLREDAYGLASIPSLRPDEAVADIMYNRMRQRDQLEDPTIEQIAEVLSSRLDWQPGDKGFSRLNELLAVVHESNPRVK